MNVSPGGSIGDTFIALAGAELNFDRGAGGRFVDAESGGEINYFGGSILFANAFDAGEFNLYGGSIDRFHVHGGSHVTLRGGSVNNAFEAHDGSLVRVLGGTVSGFVVMLGQSTIEMTGGRIQNGLLAESGAALHLSVLSVLVDGAPATEAAQGEPYEVEQRDSGRVGRARQRRPVRVQPERERRLRAEPLRPRGCVHGHDRPHAGIARQRANRGGCGPRAPPQIPTDAVVCDPATAESRQPTPVSPETVTRSVSEERQPTVSGAASLTLRVTKGSRAGRSSGVSRL